MREIKFRAWVDGKMHDGVQPLLESPQPTHVMVPVGNLVFIEPTGDKRYWYEVKVDAIMQFTGLHDKNGKEIFEGDIVRMEDATAKVVFWERPPEFGLDPDNEDAWCDDWNLSDDSERMIVIDNIYESKV